MDRPLSQAHGPAGPQGLLHYRLGRIRSIADAPLAAHQRWLYLVCPSPADSGIAPEQMMRSLVLQAIFGLPRPKALIEQIWSNPALRQFVGVETGASQWNADAFRRYREQLLDHHLVHRMLREILVEASGRGLNGPLPLNQAPASDSRPPPAP